MSVYSGIGEEFMQDQGELVIKGIRIESKVLQKRNVRPCGEGKCIAACCSGGVWLREDEAPRILEWADAIKACLPADRHDHSKWFESGKDDEEEEIGTSTVDDPVRPGQHCCVFLQPDRKCSLQVVSQENNLGWPGIKPFYCATYPFYTEDDALMVDDETPLKFKGAACRRPSSDKRPLYEIYKMEAILALGEDGYRELLSRVARSQRR